MRKRISACVMVAAASAVGLLAVPSVYPTGTTIYDPAKAWSGYTVFVLPDTGAVLIDMNGAVVKQWTNFEGSSGGPTRVLPGGFVMGALGKRPPYQESRAVALFDWAGTELWRFDRGEQIAGPKGQMEWSARQHHDWQRDDFPAGYYSPEASPRSAGPRTLVLSHSAVTDAAVSERPLEDDTLFEVDAKGAVTWTWRAHEHADEFGFSPAARAAIRSSAPLNRGRGNVDWLHINSATYLGPNKWFDGGDRRFDPRHVIISSRNASFMAIVGRDGKIAWRMGPDYRDSDGTRGIGQIIGQHHPHLIPKGLPGAGNLLVFDNGGASGYGFEGPTAPNGVDGVARGSSRVLEIDPVAMKKVWDYSVAGTESFRFFSHYVSSAQRLPNGNTLITEGADGRLFEVTPATAIVWEYVSPFFGDGANAGNRVYRAYRLPYDWVPQLPKPSERAVVPPDRRDFRVPLR